MQIMNIAKIAAQDMVKQAHSELHKAQPEIKHTEPCKKDLNHPMNKNTDFHVYHHFGYLDCSAPAKKTGRFQYNYDKHNMYSRYPSHLRKNIGDPKNTKKDAYSDEASYDDSGVYNYGAPGTLSDKKKQMNEFRVKYTKTPSVTGMFTDTGPPGAPPYMLNN